MTAKRFKAAFFVLAAAAFLALLAGCDGLFGGSSDTVAESGGTESGTGSAGGQADYADVGYGPYTASGPYGGSITVEGVPEGIRITKVNPPQADTIMVCVWEAGAGSDGAVYESYHRVFYRKTGFEEPEINPNEQNDFIYPFVRKDTVYNIDLITWGVNSNGTWINETHSNVIQVRAGGGQGDLRTIIYDSGYDSTEGQLWFDVKEERPAGLPHGGKFYYSITLRLENPNVSIGTPWMEWDKAQTEFTEIPLSSYYYDDEGNRQEDSVDLKDIPVPFRVGYNFLYRISANEVYQGNIMTEQKKLFNAN